MTEPPPPAPPPPPVYYGRGPSLDYELANMRIPCDRLAAVVFLRDIAGRLGANAALFSVLGLAVPIVFMVVFFSVAASTGAPAMFIVFAALILIVFLAGGVYGASRLTGRRREILELASAIESGLIPEEAYCNRSVLEALAYLRARRGAMLSGVR